jgi:hypothetical protein
MPPRAGRGPCFNYSAHLRSGWLQCTHTRSPPIVDRSAHSVVDARRGPPSNQSTIHQLVRMLRELLKRVNPPDHARGACFRSPPRRSRTPPACCSRGSLPSSPWAGRAPSPACATTARTHERESKFAHQRTSMSRACGSSNRETEALPPPRFETLRPRSQLTCAPPLHYRQHGRRRRGSSGRRLRSTPASHQRACPSR